jgi:lactam utilization protein B
MDRNGISLSFDQPGTEATPLRLHLDFALFARILHALARTAPSLPVADAAYRDAVREGARALCQALDERYADRADIAQMTPEDAVLLLHVME